MAETKKAMRQQLMPFSRPVATLIVAIFIHSKKSHALIAAWPLPFNLFSGA